MKNRFFQLGLLSFLISLIACEKEALVSHDAVDIFNNEIIIPSTNSTTGSTACSIPANIPGAIAVVEKNIFNKKYYSLYYVPNNNYFSNACNVSSPVSINWQAGTFYELDEECGMGDANEYIIGDTFAESGSECFDFHVNNNYCYEINANVTASVSYSCGLTQYFHFSISGVNYLDETGGYTCQKQVIAIGCNNGKVNILSDGSGLGETGFIQIIPGMIPGSGGKTIYPTKP